MNYNNLKNIQNVLDNSVREKRLAGVNALVYKDGFEQGYFESGMADIENGKKYARDTIVRLYSMTKPIVSVAALSLLEEGKLDLGEELSYYLPEFENLHVCTDKGRDGKVRMACRNILIQDLMNMTSGYTYGAWNKDCTLGEHLTSDLIAELNKDSEGSFKITTQQVASRLSKIPVSFEPGTNFNYGFSADIMGAVIEKISGMKLSEFLQKRIFEPLGMNDTSFYVPDEKQHRLAKAYWAKTLEHFSSCNLGIQYRMDHKPSFESGGAGLCSTIDDYMKFACMLADGGEFNGRRILKKQTVEYIASARLRDDIQQKFNQKMEHLSGYTYCNFMRIAFEPGKCKTITEFGEFGWDGWLGAFVSIDLKNKLCLVLTMQRPDSGLTATARKVKDIVYTSL